MKKPTPRLRGRLKCSVAGCGLATRLSLANRDVAAHPLNVLEIVDGRSLVCLIDKVNETEATLAAGVPIEGQGALAHLSVLTEQVDEIFPFCVPGQVSDENGQKTSALEVDSAMQAYRA